jgi:tetratricopeptide (TPR) repeat protein
VRHPSNKGASVEDHDAVITIPLSLQHAMESEECVLFVGSGIGAYATDPDGKTGPDGRTLAAELAHHFGVDTDGNLDLAKIAEAAEIRKGRTELETFIKARLAKLEPTEPLRWLFSQRWKAIFTTNYDFVIERAYELNPTPPQNPRTISVTSDLVPLDPRFDVPIYHLHGCLFGPSAPAIVITRADYAKFRERRRMLFELLKLNFATSTVLYVGYSNNDPNWDMVLSEIAAEFYPKTIPKSFRVAPTTSSLDVELLKNRNIDTISIPLDQFCDIAKATLRDLATDADRLKRIQHAIPSDLSQAFEKNPAPVLRLLASWTYVNQAAFNATPNIAEFLRGDRANWALIADNQQFERDIEDDLYEELLEYATSIGRNTLSLAVVGSAGYGMTTVLLALAVRMTKEHAGPVFMHKPGNPYVEGDVEFAASLFSGARPFFFVDNAADNSEGIQATLSRLKALKVPAMFVLGDRKNEWHQARGKFNPSEYEIEPLSDPEINRLLDCLARHGALDKLAPLDRDKQFAVIKTKHGKELLVTMREATQDNSFDAILESEYRGIGDDLSQRLYLTVCCFFQHGAYARDSLLAEILGYPLADLHSATAGATEGVVIHDSIDEAQGVYGARARHRTIATIVWERCGEEAGKERLLQSSLSLLNLNYGSDKEAFERFIRSDRIVEVLRTFEGKVRFFETACQKDPESPYVRQHYARMLDREGKPELALSQIDAGIALQKDVRVLYHTRGVILSHLAIRTESLDLARKRLAQAEHAFRQGLAMYDRDEYCYHGLASLYLDWAKRVRDPESTEYIAKCEEVISEGLRVVRFRDGLKIVSSEVEKWLGNNPERIAALRQAVADSHGSIVARYLLGRTLRADGKSQEALDILDFIIKNHPNEFRACIEYSLALLDSGAAYTQAIAVLEIGSLYGLSDPRYIATLGGMFFMNRNFSQAEAVFANTRKRSFQSSEINAVHFRPLDPANRAGHLRLDGRVAAVRAGYAFIENPEYPRFLCPGSKFGGLLLTEGMTVSFEPVFCAKGAIADKPQRAGKP